MTAERRHAHTIGEIADMLARQVQQLCLELLPAGVKDGAEWRVGSVAGEPGRSMAVHLAGTKAGAWCDFASGNPDHRGDALDLVAQVLFRGDKAQALRWARTWLGLDAGDHRRFQTARAERPESMPRERDEDGKRLSALRLFLDAQASLLGTPAAAYLAGRGLDLAELRRQPRALRFHPAAVCGELSTPGNVVRVPAMVAAVVDAKGEHRATHRTFLEPNGRGGWRKHSGVKKAKKVLGGYAGATIRLWRGKSGKPLAEAPDDDTVALVEGIEDGLTVALACPEWRVLAVVSLSNLVNVQLPEQLLDVVLVCDRDGENPQARLARERATHRLMTEGRSVREARPPEGFKDFNDWWQAERGQA